MSKGSEPSNVTQTNKTILPTWLSNANQYGAVQSQGLYRNGPPAYYPGNTVAPFSPLQEDALTAVQQRATSGSPVTDAAKSLATKTLNGDFLGSNPYLDSAFSHGANAIQQRIGSQFAGSGRNPEQSVAVQTDLLGDLANKVYGGAYENERARQMQAMGQANSLANNDFYGIGQMMNAGNIVQNQTQQMIEANKNRYDYYSQAPSINLQNYMNMVNSLSHGSTGSATSPYFGPSDATKAIGGAASGAAAGGAVSGALYGSPAGPWGTLIGAGLGALMSAYG